MAAKCRNCETEIASGAPFGHCPRCLIQLGFGPLADGSPSPQRAKPGRSRLFGDYELLEQIGRGGMGVVYRARQVDLNRTVALKMILAGELASAAMVERFHVEAEAVAKLNHPQIVPIYEIGEHEGNHYFSMALVEGERLDKAIRRFVVPAPSRARTSERGAVRDAQLAIAKLITTVARAVNYAHEHGILHRDLKPSNILLDAENTPHLTDFGLAKMIAQEGSLTETGDVLGTLTYMAPEQAAGQRLSKSADIYSLGAILYELLLGQPPFRGETPAETLRQLAEQEAQNPRALNPLIDADLATICLKCLEKDPKRRYGSAGDLADDLERWEQFEPILARPARPWVRVQRWMRRNRMGTALIATLCAGLATVLILWQLKRIETRRVDLTVKTFQRQIIGEITALGDKSRPYVEINSQAFAAAVLGRLVSARKVEKVYCVALFIDRNPLGTALEYGPLLSFLETAMSKVMNKQIALNVRLYRDEEAAVADLVAGEVHFMRMPPLSYVGAHSLNPDIRPLVRANKDWTAAIFTRLESGVDRLADLRGKSFAFGEETHMISFLAKATLAATGIYGTDLRAYKFAHQLDHRASAAADVEWEHEENYSKSASIQAVLTGSCDAGVAILNRFYLVHEGKEFKNLAVFHNVSAPWATGPRVEAGASEAFRRVMVELDDLKILDPLPGIPVRYIDARDEDYHSVRTQIPLALRFDTATNSPNASDAGIWHNVRKQKRP